MAATRAKWAAASSCKSHGRGIDDVRTRISDDDEIRYLHAVYYEHDRAYSGAV